MSTVAPTPARRHLAGLDWLAGECGLTAGPVAGFGLILATGYAIAGVAGGSAHLLDWVALALGAVVVLTVNAMIPWARCPVWTTAIPSMLLLLDIALLRGVAGPVAPAVPLLLWVPIIYGALVLRPRALAPVVVLAVGILLEPTIASVLGTSAPSPAWELARAGLFAVVAPVIAIIVSRLVATRRSDADRISRLRTTSEAVVRSVAEGLVVLDEDRRIVTVNESASRILGEPAEDAVGSGLDRLLPGLRPITDAADTSSADATAAHTAPADATPALTPAPGGELRPGEYLVDRGDGRMLPLEVSVSTLVDTDGADGQVVAFRDITGRQRDRRLARANLAVTTVLASGSVAATLPQLVAALGEALGAAVITVYDLHEPDPDGRVLHLREQWESPGAPHPRFTAAAHQVTGRQGLPARVLASQRPEWIDPTMVDGAAFPRVAAAVADGLRTSICLPLGSGRPVGLMEVNFDHVESGDDLSRDLLAGLAARIGDAERRERLEAEATRHKDEFFALVSHELRTPLTSISGYLELLGEELEGDPGAGHFLEVIGRNTIRLRRLVEDLLFVARVDAGQLTLRRHRCDLVDIARAAIEVARPLADTGQLTLHADLHGPAPVHGDDGRLGQVLDNLLSNAVKFTPAGRAITLRLTTDGAHGAVLDVTDTGMGIAPDDLARLFTRFARSTRAEAANIPGVGLGLVISRAIVEAHGGTVTVSSTVGEGTTFRVQLPLAPPTDDEALPTTHDLMAPEVGRPIVG